MFERKYVLTPEQVGKLAKVLQSSDTVEIKNTGGMLVNAVNGELTERDIDTVLEETQEFRKALRKLRNDFKVKEVK